MKQALRINIIPNYSTKISAQQIKYAAPARIPLGIALLKLDEPSVRGRGMGLPGYGIAG